MSHELILYLSPDGKMELQLQAEDGSVWLTQLEMAELFDTTKQNISLHINNILKERELPEGSVVKESLTTAADGKKYRTKLFNLHMILAVGYRVRSPRGTEFRQWATRHLAEYLQKGFLMDDERLKNLGGWDYFDELLERIRDIRASEKRFYQKVRDLFALSSDYADDKVTLDAFYKLCRYEGIIPALESSHAVAFAMKKAKEMGSGSILVNLSGRGDKDIDFIADNYGYGDG
jgi:hypothetical protein